MAIVPWLPGATYTSKGMIFVVLSLARTELDEWSARCLLLSDHPRYTRPIPPGTVMQVESWSSVWEESMLIASLPKQGKVSP